RFFMALSAAGIKGKTTDLKLIDPGRDAAQRADGKQRPRVVIYDLPGRPADYVEPDVIRVRPKLIRLVA
ncbi:MAG: hypothetical protein AAF709_11030, partial [Pseudomonadota bacterium]